MRKIISCVLLACLLSPSFLAAQSADYALSSIQRINRIIEELKIINQERDTYLKELENTNKERETELQERIIELNAREAELNKLKRDLELFGNLIDEQATYLKALQWKLGVYKTTSIILCVSTLTLLIALMK